MAAVTVLTGNSSSTSGTKQATGTPAVGDLIVIITAHTGNTSATAPTDNNSSGTYTLAESRLKATSADRIQIWIRDALIAAAVSTIFTHAPGATTGGLVEVLKVTGMSTAGAAAKAKSGGQDNQTSVPSTATVTWTEGGTASSSNPCIGAVFNATSPATVAPPSGWVEREDVGYTVPTTGFELVTIDSGFTGASVVWGGTSASAFASLALELDAGLEDDLPLLVSRMVGIG